ncbi:uncharacterized protein LOC128246191 [Mya arenaria]|uniref:uncharacterized protein LOC128246191 n=1 Tax=Mya arenaria TaxID=6604 RepID=UPI0022E07CFB|nr:uncharacterized protein LOC128246191 [Mya arenaria]
MTAAGPFSLTHDTATQKCWCRKSWMGINRLYKIMTEKKVHAQIELPRITPHRLIQMLSDEHVLVHKIIQISRHKNVNSINNYRHLNNDQSNLTYFLQPSAMTIADGSAIEKSVNITAP